MIEAVTVSMCEIFPGLIVIIQLWGSERKTVVPKSKETELQELEGIKPLSVLRNNTYILKINDIAWTKSY